MIGRMRSRGHTYYFYDFYRSFHQASKQGRRMKRKNGGRYKIRTVNGGHELWCTKAAKTYY